MVERRGRFFVDPENEFKGYVLTSKKRASYYAITKPNKKGRFQWSGPYGAGPTPSFLKNIANKLFSRFED